MARDAKLQTSHIFRRSRHPGGTLRRGISGRDVQEDRARRNRGVDLGFEITPGLVEVKLGDRRQSWLERTYLPQLDGLICLTSDQRHLYAKVLPQGSLHSD